MVDASRSGPVDRRPLERHRMLKKRDNKKHNATPGSCISTPLQNNLPSPRKTQQETSHITKLPTTTSQMETQPPAAPGLEAGNRNVGKAIFAKLSRVFYCGGMKRVVLLEMTSWVGGTHQSRREWELMRGGRGGSIQRGSDGQRVVREPLLERPR
jgi:hypothetical protein